MLGQDHRAFSEVVQSQKSLALLEREFSNKIAENPEWQLSPTSKIEGVQKTSINREGYI